MTIISRRTGKLKIGELSRRTGANIETIRYYERIRLLARPARTGGNYRDYQAADVDRLAFIRHARGLGFDLDDIRALLQMSDTPEQDCADADRIARRHLVAVEQKIGRLLQLKAELVRMVDECSGGHVAECRIIEALSDHEDCGGHAALPPPASER